MNAQTQEPGDDGFVIEGFTLSVLGDRITLPPRVDAGLVLVESSHNAKN